MRMLKEICIYSIYSAMSPAEREFGNDRTGANNKAKQLTGGIARTIVYQDIYKFAFQGHVPRGL